MMIKKPFKRFAYIYDDAPYEIRKVLLKYFEKRYNVFYTGCEYGRDVCASDTFCLSNVTRSGVTTPEGNVIVRGSNVSPHFYDYYIREGEVEFIYYNPSKIFIGSIEDV